jgi:hypothetical protein
LSNTVVYKEEWAVKLQERLKRPTNWKEVCRVEYTDSRVLNNPYMSTTPSIQNGTRGTAFTFQDFALTNESITISTYRELGTFIDRADLAQSGYATQMELAERQGQLLVEKIENAMMASHADWTNIGDTGGGAVGLATTALTVSATNIDDIIRAIKREIRKANGKSYMAEKGVFIIWRPEDFELLEAFVQANGFSTADAALKNGTEEGFRYLGVDHYYTNDYTAGHLFAGVKKLYHLGICRSTWGQVSILQNPAGASGGNLSGVGIHVRADFAFKAWNTIAGLLYDINVA